MHKKKYDLKVYTLTVLKLLWLSTLSLNAQFVWPCSPGLAATNDDPCQESKRQFSHVEESERRDIIYFLIRSLTLLPARKAFSYRAPTKRPFANDSGNEIRSSFFFALALDRALPFCTGDQPLFATGQKKIEQINKIHDRARPNFN